MINYYEMLESVTRRLEFLKNSSLEHELLNAEWNELFKIQNGLLKLIKIQQTMEKE